MILKDHSMVLNSNPVIIIYLFLNIKNNFYDQCNRVKVFNPFSLQHQQAISN